MAEEDKYAIIFSGGKQYRVKTGDVIDVELLGAEGESQVTFTDVFFMQKGEERRIGSPKLAGCVVRGELLGETLGPKVIAFKYKRRKSERKKIGHRQHYSRVKITAIEG